MKEHPRLYVVSSVVISVKYLKRKKEEERKREREREKHC
jgi:hypothetical protein